MGNFFNKLKITKNPNAILFASNENSKRVCAIFNYISVSSEELSFEKNDLLRAIEKTDSFWWLAKHEKTKKIGYIPRNFVVPYEYCYLFQPAWHDVTHVEANRKLVKSKQPLGTYIIRPNSDKRHLALSVKSKEQRVTVKHYKITCDFNQYYIFQTVTFKTLVDLILHYTNFSDGLCCNLVEPFTEQEKPVVPFRKVEVDRSSFEIIKKIGKGHFSEVFMARHRISKNYVAVKILRQSHDDRKTFIKEARIMHQLNHERIVSLLGVCTLPLNEPMYIITEWMENGSLLSYIKSRQSRPIKFYEMIIILMEIADGMAFLESHFYLHRDLRAANILVGKDRSVKVADFGLARMVEDLYVYGESDYMFPVRWMAPEVLVENKFTLKSDVWSFGILMYEVITHGQNPYPGFSNDKVLVVIREGYTMPKPTGPNIHCSDKYYSVMQTCWTAHRQRPSFSDLFDIFKDWANLNSDVSSS